MRYFIFFGLLLSFCSFAFLPDEALLDESLESEARIISGLLRCVVCQNQTIEESSSSLARDLRLLVRRRLEAGDSRREVLDYIALRYGDFVLLRPRFSLGTLLLWLSSPFIVLCGGLFLWFYYRRNSVGSVGSGGGSGGSGSGV